MLKTVMTTTALTLAVMTGPAFAQTPAAPATPVVQAGTVDVQKLIGRTVVNAQNETIGEIESVIIDSGKQARHAIIGVGGFLGIGERHVAVDYSRLSISANGEKIVLNASKDELKALPPYTYADGSKRRSVFVETGGPVPAAQPGYMPVATTAPMGANDLIGLNIRNGANETIGEIKDMVVAPDGKVSEVIVGVGGFLGVGERYVAIAWDQLRVGRNAGNTLVAQVAATKEQLMAMPALKRDKSTWVRG